MFISENMDGDICLREAASSNKCVQRTFLVASLLLKPLTPALALKLDFQSDYGTIFGLEGRIMNITSDIKPVTYLKSRAADLLNQINETHRPVIITQNGEPRAILQDPKSYENMRNAIGILKLISEGEADIRGGRIKSQEDVFDEIENALKASHK